MSDKEKTEDKIEQRGEEFVVLSMSGDELGTYATEEEARERLRQIEAAKEAKGDQLDEVRRVDFLGEIHLDPEREDGVLAERTPEGFLRVDARLTRTGVFEYSDGERSWGEMRTEDEVFSPDAMKSFELSVVTDDHPPTFVSASNVRDVQVGHVGTDVRRDGDHLVASRVITDENTIRAIEGGKRELSCGYTARVIQDSGVADDGTPFAARQTSIRGNHVALVDRGRAGPSCRILLERGDALHHTPEGIHTMTEKKNPEPAATVDTSPAPTPTVDAAPELEELSRLRARIDALETELESQRASEPVRIDARVRLVTTAREVLGREVKTDGVSDLDLMRAVIREVNPRLDERVEENASNEGYIRASFDAAVELHRDRETASSEAATVIFDAMSSEKTDLDADYRAYVSRLTSSNRNTAE